MGATLTVNPRNSAPGASARTPVLMMGAGSLHVALPLDRVREVLSLAATKPAPETPSWVSGLLTVGDDVVPVIDLGARLGRAATPVSVDHHCVVVEGDPSFALHVERALSVMEVATTSIRKASDVLPWIEHVSHVGIDDAGAVLITEPSALLDGPEAEAVAALLEQQAAGTG